MTVVAYRNGTLAADSQITDNGVIRGSASKLFRLRDGGMGAWTGDQGQAASLIAWLFNDVEPPLPAPPPADDAALIWWDADGVGNMHAEGHTHQLPAAPYYAFGHGSDIALGAMAMGASAQEAVGAAIEWSIYCGAPLCWMTVKGGDGSRTA